MFSYFEPHFVEKFHWESVYLFFFSNFGHVTIFAKGKFIFGRHFKTEHFLNVRFADLWLF